MSNIIITETSYVLKTSVDNKVYFKNIVVRASSKNTTKAFENDFISKKLIYFQQPVYNTINSKFSL